MVQEIRICKCDRCGSVIYDGDSYHKLNIENGSIDLCMDCYDKFQVWWNEFLRPNPFSFNTFKPNEEIMYKDFMGVIR